MSTIRLTDPFVVGPSGLADPDDAATAGGWAGGLASVAGAGLGGIGQIPSGVLGGVAGAAIGAVAQPEEEPDPSTWSRLPRAPEEEEERPDPSTWSRLPRAPEDRDPEDRTPEERESARADYLHTLADLRYQERQLTQEEQRAAALRAAAQQRHQQRTMVQPQLERALSRAERADRLGMRWRPTPTGYELYQPAGYADAERQVEGGQVDRLLQLVRYHLGTQWEQYLRSELEAGLAYA